MTQLTTHRFTAADYDRMVETGILTEDDRVELLNGEIVEMSPIGPPHNAVVNRLIACFARLVPARAILSVQGPLALDDRSRPEPDVMLSRPRADFYANSHARPADVLLLIEVSDSSVEKDRRVKLPLYAHAAVAEVWIVDLVALCVTVHREPSGDAYRSVTRHVAGAQIAPAAFADVIVSVDSLLK